MLCARVLRGHHGGERKQLFILRWFEAAFEGWLKSYEWALDKVLAYRFVVLLVTFRRGDEAEDDSHEVTQEVLSARTNA